MKTSLDTFLSLTALGHALYPPPSLSANQGAASVNFIDLPEDAILQIFANLPTSTLRQLCLVSKKFTLLATSDVLWQTIAESILFSEEIATKSQHMTYKDFCKVSLSITKVDNIITGPSHSYQVLKPRDPAFVNRVKQMQLPNYKILTPSETVALCQNNDTISLIQVAGDCIDGYFDFHHAAHQQVGDYKFVFLNCTEYVISFNSDFFMLINNKLTTIHFTFADCQLLIYHDIKSEKISIYNSDIGDDAIGRVHFPFKDLELEDYTKINKYNKSDIFKSRTAAQGRGHFH